MPVYMVHGFRWPRAGFTGIRVFIVLHNLEEATAEYLQKPITSQLIREQLQRQAPDIVTRLPELQLIEEYDPDDVTSNAAVTKDHAFVAAKVMTLSDAGAPGSTLSWNTQKLDQEGSGLSEDGSAALEGLRDQLAPGEKIGWWLVYNGDPPREYPQSDDELDGDSAGYQTYWKDSLDSPRTPEKFSVSLLFDRVFLLPLLMVQARWSGTWSRIFGKRRSNS